MIHTLRERRKQGRRTIDFPAAPPALPERFRGLPVLGTARCADGCRACAALCPTGALQHDESKGLSLDIGRCTMCGACEEGCPSKSVAVTQEYRMSARARGDFKVAPGTQALVAAVDERARSLFGRSLRLRQVSAGGCNGCEVEVAALQNVVFDFARFGIQFVASPRHADGLLITGPVTYAAVPAPKIVIAAGACAISGGPYADLPETMGGAESVVPVDLFIAGCPPHPVTLLDGLLRLLGRIESDEARRPG
jgi:Ni,Fe-hydrogenase III small subunit/formate hydrogenlyase subunit 6/NADH:ubiquinone oxidoreductase subunit I